jgi:hypothetical protein
MSLQLQISFISIYLRVIMSLQLRIRVIQLLLIGIKLSLLGPDNGANLLIFFLIIANIEFSLFSTTGV